MSKVIAVNSGSSSLKFQLYDMPSETVLTSGQAERIGQDMGVFTIKINGEKKVTNLPLPDHKAAVDILLRSLTEEGIVKDLSEIKGAGHRIVQGGAYFSESVVVDEKEAEGQTVLELHVAQGDMGKVIGKQGRIAKAIRTVVKAAATRENKKVTVEII